MKTCPVCKAEYDAAICPDCGFDPSCDYESFPTLAMLAGSVESISRRNQLFSNGQTLFRCPLCSSHSFGLCPAEQQVRCLKCQTVLALDDIFSVTVIEEPSEDAPAPRRVQSVALGTNHTVVLYDDGTVAAVGNNDYGQCNVYAWKNIRLILAGDGYTLGISDDPDDPEKSHIVTAGHNLYGQCNVSSATDCIAASGGKYHTLFLKKRGAIRGYGVAEGTVEAFGQSDRSQCFVKFWRNITAVSAGDYHSLGLRNDGTVVAVGANSEGQCWVDHWKQIKAISAGATHSVGLRYNGTVIAAGSNDHRECDVGRWRNITAISAGNDYTLGLTAQGYIEATENPKLPWVTEQAMRWSNIENIWAGESHVVALRKDGTLVAAGSNSDGQCDVSGLSILRQGGIL